MVAVHFHGARRFLPLQQGFLPDVISTDLHTQSMNGGMKDLANVMSKFIAMGMSIQDVIKRTTVNPANVINRKELGTSFVGSEADVAVFNLAKGDYGFIDIRNVQLKAKQKLEAELNHSCRQRWCGTLMALPQNLTIQKELIKVLQVNEIIIIIIIPVRCFCKHRHRNMIFC